MRIAIFDYATIRGNPTGSCNLALLAGLCREHEFTVFSPAFENPCPERIEWIRIPVPARPLALLFLAFHAAAPLFYLWYRIRGGRRFDLIQMAESNLLFGDVCYAHFCHRAFLKNHWKSLKSRGLRGKFRWLDHWFHALLEPWVYKSRDRIVVPSKGLAREIEMEYPGAAGKLRVISNPIDLDKMRQPPEFDRPGFRGSLGIGERETVLLFCALGHFERKGLGLLLEALGDLPQYPWKLIVVGGQPDVLAAYRSRGDQRVIYAGMQKDIRPFLWASDAFILPSAYETFSLVTFEAAAAAVPSLVPSLYGVEEFLKDGTNGFCLIRSRVGVVASLERLFRLQPAERLKLGQQARHDVQSFGIAPFLENWRAFYGRS